MNAAGVLIRGSADELSDDDWREIVVLSDVQDLAYDEISRITGLPLGTVKSHIHRGRARVQAQFGLREADDG